MGNVHVHLEEGFDHDRVLLAAAGEDRTELDVTTRHQIGLAAVVELTVPDGAPCALRITLPERGVLAETTLDPAVTPHVRVSVRHGELVVQLAAQPPMLA